MLFAQMAAFVNNQIMGIDSRRGDGKHGGTPNGTRPYRYGSLFRHVWVIREPQNDMEEDLGGEIF